MTETLGALLAGFGAVVAAEPAETVVAVLPFTCCGSCSVGNWVSMPRILRFKARWYS